MDQRDARQLRAGGAPPGCHQLNPHERGSERFDHRGSARAPAAADCGLEARAGRSAYAPIIDDSPDDPERSRARPGLRLFLLEHRLIILALAAATVVRLVTMLAYPPAFWFPDSMPYVLAALHPAPYNVRPVGYSFLLLLLEPAHSVLLVIAAQHLMGIVVGAQIYALLRRHQLPAWGSTLAAIPALFSAYAIQIEHYVLSDAFFGLLVTSAICLLLWRPRPRIWVCVAVGLLLAWAAVDRSQGMLLIVPFILYLVVGRLGVRRFLLSAFTMLVAFLVPVLAYCAWFDATYGAFEITTSTGAFLYSRVATFANCSVIKPPADERWLCVSTPVSKRPSEDWYAWSSQSPIYHAPGTGGLSGEFGSEVNHLATNFAERAMTAQPFAYLRVTWDATIETFMPLTDTNQSYTQYVFPAGAPLSLHAIASQTGEDVSYGYTYNGGANPNPRRVQPYASWMQVYQHYVAMPGPLLGALVLLGLIGGLLGWRRGWPTLLAWSTGAILIVTPAATADYDARYVVASIPVFCVAAALGVREIGYRVRSRETRPRISRGGTHARSGHARHTHQADRTTALEA